MSRAATYVLLRRRPSGVPGEGDLELASAPLPPPDEGEVVVANRFVSIDPYMRGRMNDSPSYFPPWPLGEPLDGDAIGVVVESREPRLPEGTWVHSEYGLRDRFVAASGLRPLAPPPAGFDYGCYLDLLGGTGFTAYLGVVDAIAPRAGETVFVSTAAGSVGSIAGQLCSIAGARTIGSAGSAEKVRIAVDRYRFDAAFDYRAEPAATALARLAPEGIDGFFDNVGGEQLEAAIESLRIGGRIAKCGAIVGYNSSEPPPGPRNLHHFFGKRLQMTGFLVSDHGGRRPEFEAAMRVWMERGEIRADRRVFAGLEQTVAAFQDLFGGGNVGKTMIELGAGGDG